MTTIVVFIWKELMSLGYSGNITTLPELLSWIRRIHLTHKPELLQYESSEIQDEIILSSKLSRYSDFSIVLSGSFGTIYLVYRENRGKEEYVFLKTCPIHPTILLKEGILQSIAYSVLSYYNFPKAVPRVLDIVKHPTLGIVLAIERNPNARLFADYLKTNVHWGIPSKLNDTLFLSVLTQIATYLAILEVELGMNHRDLTGTNVLMVAPTIPVHQSVTLGSNTWMLHYTHQTILIDFGFACIGTSDGKQTVSAGEFLPTADFCPKQGRDLFLFLSSVWDVELFRSSLTEPVKQLFHKWLHDKTSTNWANWLITSAKTNLKSIYLLTNSEKFTSVSCSPLQILKDISEFDPNIIQFIT